MGALSITGIKPGSTSLKLTAGKITKTVPITVLSRNLQRADRVPRHRQH